MKIKHFRPLFSALVALLLLSSCSMTKDGHTFLASQTMHPAQALMQSHWERTVSTESIPEPVLGTNGISNMDATMPLAAKPFQKHQHTSIVPASTDCEEIRVIGGERISCKIIEVNETTVKYRRCNEPDGAIYTVKKADIKEIRHADGSTETIEAPSVEETRPIAPRMDVNYLKLWILLSLGSGAFLALGLLLAFLFAPVGALILVIFYAIAGLMGAASAVYFVCWLLKLVS